MIKFPAGGGERRFMQGKRANFWLLGEIADFVMKVKRPEFYLQGEKADFWLKGERTDNGH